MARYAYSGPFEDFPATREALELQGAVIESVSTDDNVLHVYTAEPIPADIATSLNLTEV